MSWDQFLLVAGFAGVGLTAFPSRRMRYASLCLFRVQLRVVLIAVATIGVMLTLQPDALTPYLPLVRDLVENLMRQPPQIGPERVLLIAATLFAAIAVPLIAATDVLAKAWAAPATRTLGDIVFGSSPRPVPVRQKDPIRLTEGTAVPPVYTPKERAERPPLPGSVVPPPARPTLGDLLFHRAGR